VNRREADVLQRREVIEQVMKLKYHSRPAAADAPTHLRFQTRNRAQHSRLARA
jgi:hypothetical protein